MADGGPDVLHAVGVATVLGGHLGVMGEEVALVLVGGVHAEQQGKSSGGGHLDGRKRRRRHDDRGAGLRGRTGNQRDRPEAEEAGSLVVGGHPALFESGEEEVERVGEAVLEPGQAGSEHLEVHGPPRPTPRAKRPPERWSRRAVSSASATGWRLESMHTAVPIVIRLVRPRTLAAKATAEGHTP